MLERLAIDVLMTRDKRFYRSFFALFFPLVLQNVINLGVNVADNIMLGAYSEAALSGAAAVAVVEPIAEKRTLAMQLGAALTLDPLTQDVPAELKHYGIGHVDVSIECVGRRETMLDAIRYAGRGATVLLFGLTPPDCEIPFKPFEAFQKELTVAASFTNPHTHERAIRLIASGRLRVRELVGEELALEDVTRALTGAVRPGKTLIRP